MYGNILKIEFLSTDNPDTVLRVSSYRRNSIDRTIKVLSCYRFFILLYLFRCSFSNNPPSLKPCTRPHIDHTVSRLYRLLIVLNNNYRVPGISYRRKTFKEFLAISRVHANTWFIEYIEHPGERRAELCRKSYPLRLST